MRWLVAALLMCAACSPTTPEYAGKACDSEHPCGDGLSCLYGVCDRRMPLSISDAFDHGEALPWKPAWEVLGATAYVKARDVVAGEGRLDTSFSPSGSEVFALASPARARVVEQEVTIRSSRNAAGFGLLCWFQEEPLRYDAVEVTFQGSSARLVVTDETRREPQSKGITTDVTFGVDYRMRVECLGSGNRRELRLKIWPKSMPVPVDQSAVWVREDSTAPAEGRVGLRFGLFGGATYFVDDYQALERAE